MLSSKSKTHNDKRKKGAASSTPTAYCLLPTVYSYGFSLAELMVAVGILGIGMLIIAAAFPVAIDQSRQALELSTSQMVFYEAVNTLKSKVTWIELEQYINPENSGASTVLGAYGALETTYRLGPDENNPSDRRIYLLSFGRVGTDPSPPGTLNDFFNNPAFENKDCVFSLDNTYGWMAAVQKIGNQCYKFWIFILREPTGVLDNAGDFKFSFLRLESDVAPAPTTPTYQPTQNLRFSNNTFPGKGTTFLANDGQLYRILDSAVFSAVVPTQKIVDASCDKQVSDGKGSPNNVSIIAFPNATKGATRKNSVVAVFQTVISY